MQLGRVAVAVTATVAAARVPAHEASGEHEAELAQTSHQAVLSLGLDVGGFGHQGRFPLHNRTRCFGDQDPLSSLTPN